jgi:hypothetical protein
MGRRHHPKVRIGGGIFGSQTSAQGCTNVPSKARADLSGLPEQLQFPHAGWCDPHVDLVCGVAATALGSIIMREAAVLVPVYRRQDGQRPVEALEVRLGGSGEALPLPELDEFEHQEPLARASRSAPGVSRGGLRRP